MSHTAIAMLLQTRQLTSSAVADLTAEQWLAIPEGFDNNIAWNIGHVIVVQQSLIYRLSGLQQYTDKALYKQFRPGSAPKDWTEQPDIDSLKEMLQAHPSLLVEDYASGKFQHYTEYTTSTGVTLRSVEDGIVFNQFHEGLHLGTVLALRNVV